jgi:hypothetical protein
MYVYELLQSGIDFQSEWKVVEFDFETYERVELDPAEASDRRIGYMYCEDDILYIEVEPEDTEF